MAYAEYCARRGALSEGNQAVTSDRGKHPDPSHQDRDPTCVSSALCPFPDKFAEHLASDEGTGSFTSASVWNVWALAFANLVADGLADFFG